MSRVSHNESVSGNAEKPPNASSNKDGVQGKFWKVNYHLKEGESFEYVFNRLREDVIPFCAEYIFGEEYGKSGETRHIEGGFITREDRKRRSAIQNVFKFSDCQKSCKRNWKALVSYCSKECNKIIHSDGVVVAQPLVKMTYDLLRPEQKEIADMFTEREDPLFGRKIYWFWEETGCWGKSVLATYMIDQMGATEVSGKGNDVLCGIAKIVENTGSCPPIVIYDIPRSTVDYVSYQSIEKIKDGKFFSGKYESGMVRYNKPHVICFANEPPQVEKLSGDRWIIKNIEKVEGNFYESD